MLLKKIILPIIFLSVFSGIAFADTFQVDYVRDILKINLYQIYVGGTPPLDIIEVKDLLNFYLSIPPAEIVVDIPAEQPIFDILNKGSTADFNLFPKCSDGTKFGECSATILL